MISGPLFILPQVRVNLVVVVVVVLYLGWAPGDRWAGVCVVMWLTTTRELHAAYLVVIRREDVVLAGTPQLDREKNPEDTARGAQQETNPAQVHRPTGSDDTARQCHGRDVVLVLLHLHFPQ